MDENLFNEETEAYFKNIYIYILHYPYGDKASVSYGLLNDLPDFDIEFTCWTEYGTSGSPILNLANNKVIGIHKQNSKNINFNIGNFFEVSFKRFFKQKMSKSYLEYFKCR